MYARNNGGGLGGAIYFDLTVTNPNGITVTSLDTNTAETVSFGLDLYVASGSHAGNETNAGAWTLTLRQSVSGAMALTARSSLDRSMLAKRLSGLS